MSRSFPEDQTGRNTLKSKERVGHRLHLRSSFPPEQTTTKTADIYIVLLIYSYFKSFTSIKFLTFMQQFREG